jgi:hypothetical protein
LAVLVLGIHPSPGTLDDVKVFTFEWTGQLPTVLGVQKAEGFRSQFGGYASLNQGG